MTFKPILSITMGAMLALSACSDSGSGDGGPPKPDLSGDPAKFRTVNTNDRVVIRPYAAVDADDQVHWMEALVSGFEAPDAARPPAAIKPVRVNSRCAMQPAGRNALVAAVSLSDSDFPTPFYDVVAERAGNVHDGALNLWDMALVDVVVTETRRPVHLVLHARRDVVFNLSLAEGVRLDAVTLIGGETIAVANVPEGVYVRGASLKHNKTLECAISMAHAETRGQGFRSQARRWMKPRIGRIDLTIGQYRLSHALVGPAPQSLEQRVPYRPLAGSTIQVVGHNVMFWETPQNFVRKARGLDVSIKSRKRLVVVPSG